MRPKRANLVIEENSHIIECGDLLGCDQYVCAHHVSSPNDDDEAQLLKKQLLVKKHSKGIVSLMQGHR